MQCATQVCSLLDTDDPGLGMHLEKHVSLTFCTAGGPEISISARVAGRCRGRATDLDQLPSVGHVGLGQDLLDEGPFDRVRVHAAS